MPDVSYIFNKEKKMKAKYQIRAVAQIIAVVEEYELEIEMNTEAPHEIAVNTAKEKLHKRAEKRFGKPFEHSLVSIKEIHVTEIEK